MVNDGSGAFAPAEMEVPAIPSPGLSADPRTYALADANGDGLDDLLIEDPWAGQNDRRDDGLVGAQRR